MRIAINGKEIVISETVFNSILVVIVLSILALIVNYKIKKERVDKAPSNFINLIEMLVEFVDNLVLTNMGNSGMNLAPFIITILSYMGISNTLGIIGIKPPTSDLSITLTLGIGIFLLIQYTKLSTHGGLFGYLKSFTKPLSFITPINIISDLSNPVSMSFRLFGNIMSGALIIALLHGSLGYFSPIIAAPLHLYFDLFIGLLQAYIFVMLTTIFVDQAKA